LGDHKASLESLNQVLERGSEDVKGAAYQELGQTYMVVGQFENAAVAYKAALAHGQSNQWVRFGLAVALLRLGNLQEACRNYTVARELGYQA